MLLDDVITLLMAAAQNKWLWQESTKTLFQSDSTGNKPCKSLLLGTNDPGKKPYSSPLQLEAKQHPDRTVTIEDVKTVAVSLVSEITVTHSSKRVTMLFDQCYRTDQFNALLWTVLLYFDAFQQYHSARSNENLTTSGVLGDSARAALLAAEKKLGQNQTNLGQAYSHFILGLEHIPHHSKGGRSRTSMTHIDRALYEILYEFITMCAWVCFGYKDWDSIHSELGRILRTKAFSRDYVPTAKDTSSIKKGSDYIAYRIYCDRPGPGSLKDLQSPAVLTVLPSTTRKGKDFHQFEGIFIPQKESPPKQLGIIGSKLSHYNPHTLQRLEQE